MVSCEQQVPLAQGYCRNLSVKSSKLMMTLIPNCWEQIEPNKSKLYYLLSTNVASLHAPVAHESVRFVTWFASTLLSSHLAVGAVEVNAAIIPESKKKNSGAQTRTHFSRQKNLNPSPT